MAELPDEADGDHETAAAALPLTAITDVGAPGTAASRTWGDEKVKPTIETVTPPVTGVTTGVTLIDPEPVMTVLTSCALTSATVRPHNVSSDVGRNVANEPELTVPAAVRWGAAAWMLKPPLMAS